MDYLNIQDIKKHLNVDFNDDDAYITALGSMAEELVGNEIGGEGLSDVEDEQGNIPKPLVQAMYILISHFYDIREPVVVGVSLTEVPYSVKYLINRYKEWTLS